MRATLGYYALLSVHGSRSTRRPQQLSWWRRDCYLMRSVVVLYSSYRVSFFSFLLSFPLPQLFPFPTEAEVATAIEAYKDHKGKVNMNRDQQMTAYAWYIKEACGVLEPKTTLKALPNGVLDKRFLPAQGKQLVSVFFLCGHDGAQRLLTCICS